MNIQIRKAVKNELKEIAGIFKTEFSQVPYYEKWSDKTALGRIKNYVGEKRFHPQKYRSLTDTIVYKDTVVMLIWAAKPPIAVVIKNRENAEGYKNQFLFMWKNAKR